tara:strand:- start:2067 stop:2297 length:231 start_codon:yes stop_codon:yes gene_type:complete
MKKELYLMLLNQSLSDKSKAVLTLDLLGNNPVGIGDHSTADFYNNANEALTALADADDRIETLEKYYKDKVNKEVL